MEVINMLHIEFQRADLIGFGTKEEEAADRWVITKRRWPQQKAAEDKNEGKEAEQGRSVPEKIDQKQEKEAVRE